MKPPCGSGDIQPQTQIAGKAKGRQEAHEARGPGGYPAGSGTRADQANIDNAKLQLIYTEIRSPITGVAGLRLIDHGNIVHAADSTGIVVITQVQPIAVVFNIPEDALPQVRAVARAFRSRRGTGTTR
jgi:multidrug efflux system membrane fusion protein